SDFVSRDIHCIPKGSVVYARVDGDKRARNAKLVELACQRNVAPRVSRPHLADAADGEDDSIVGDVPKCADCVHVWNLLEQLSFRIRAQGVQTCSRDLKVEMAEQAVRM